MKRLILLMVFLFLLPSAFAFEIVDKCLNSSFIQSTFNLDSGTSIVQTTNCTYGCDTNLNQCMYEKKSDASYIAIPVVLIFITIVFFYLGMNVNPGPYFSLFKNGMQTLFFFLGLWFIILDMGAISSIGMMSGISLAMTNLIGTGISVITYIIYFVMFLFIISFLIMALMSMMPKKRKPFQA